MTTPRPTPGDFCWFECGSTDGAAAKTFYTELFGWATKDVPMPGEQGGFYTMFRVGEDDVAGLYQMSGPQFEGVPSHWATYVAVESADDTVARANALGGKTCLPPMDVPGAGRIAILQDPGGANIGVFQAGEHHGSPPVGTVTGTFGWSELHTRDTAAAGAFYGELFSWKLRGGSAEEPEEYTEFQAGGRSIGGMKAMSDEHPGGPPSWLPYVMVDDCEASAARAAELGARVLVGPMDIENVGRFAVFMDPAGAKLAIVQLT